MGAAATITRDTTTAVDGAASADVNVTQPAPTSWYAQLMQPGVLLVQGHTYTVSFWAKGATARSIDYVLQADVAPTWTVFMSGTANVTTNWQHYSATYTHLAATDRQAALLFNLAQTSGQIWIDNVLVTAPATPVRVCNTTTPTPTPLGQLPPPPGYTNQNLIFDDRFAGTTLNGNKWNTYVTSRAANGWPWNSDGAGGSGTGNPRGYDAEYMLPGQVTANNGLNLTALKEATPGYYASTPVTFPWRSGVVSTYGKFQFDGGYLQVKARMPSGNGMWPAVWMLPGPGGTNGDDNEIDLFEGGFTGNGVSANQNYSWHLLTPAGPAGGVTNVGVDLTQGYHVYGLQWIPGQSITWYLDWHQVGQVTSATYPIPNEPMEVLVSLAVANSNASGWHTVNDTSSPSPVQMQVAEVQVYQWVVPVSQRRAMVAPQATLHALNRRISRCCHAINTHDDVAVAAPYGAP